MTVRHCVPVPQAPEEWLHRNRSIEEHVGGTCEQMLKKRYQYASLVCDSFLRKNITRADVTARDIANYHNLTGKFSLSTSAMLIFLYSNCIREDPVWMVYSRNAGEKKS